MFFSLPKAPLDRRFPVFQAQALPPASASARFPVSLASLTEEP
jgi:hypothetical protein